MSKAQNLISKARARGVSEGKAEAVDAVRSVTAAPKPTIIHVEPHVDTKALADQLKALEAFLPALEALAGKEIDLSGLQDAITGAKFNPAEISKAITGLTEAVSAGEGYHAEIRGLLGALEASEARQQELVSRVEDNTKAIREMVGAFKAKRTLKFTDGGAVLEAN